MTDQTPADQNPEPEDSQSKPPATGGMFQFEGDVELFLPHTGQLIPFPTFERLRATLDMPPEGEDKTYITLPYNFSIEFKPMISGTLPEELAGLDLDEIERRIGHSLTDQINNRLLNIMLQGDWRQEDQKPEDDEQGD